MGVPVDVEALRTFLAVQRAGSVTGASTALFRSQPAVSRRLTLLERELGVPLFERVPGGVMLSDAGRALMPFAESVLATIRDAASAVREVGVGTGGSVAFALVGSLAGTALTAVLRQFAQRRQGVELILHTATSQEVSDLVGRAEVAVGLRYGHDPSPDLQCETLFAERLVVIAAADHPLVATPGRHLRSLAAQRWIAFPVPPPQRAEAAVGYVREAMAAAGIEEARILRIDSLTAQKRLVEAGFGIALVPTSSIHDELAAGSLAVLDVVDLQVSRPVTALTRRNGYLGAAARILLDELRTMSEP